MVRAKGWRLIIDRFRKRLSSWKIKLFSINGRLALNRSVLGSLGIYFLSLFKMSFAVCQILEAYRSQFFKGN